MVPAINKLKIASINDLILKKTVKRLPVMLRIHWLPALHDGRCGPYRSEDDSRQEVSG